MRNEETKALLEVLRQDRSLAVDVATRLSVIRPRLGEEDGALIEQAIAAVRGVVIPSISTVIAEVGEEGNSWTH